MKLGKKIKVISQAAALGLAVLVGPCVPYTTDQTEHVVVTSFGNPVKLIVQPEVSRDIKLDTEALRANCKQERIAYSEGAGLRVKLPWHTINRIDKRVNRWDGYAEEIPTKDKKYLWIDTTARFFVDNPLQYFRTVGLESVALAKLSDIIDSQTRNVLTRENLIEIVRTDNRKMTVTERELADTVQVDEILRGRTKIMQEISELSRKDCREYGIMIHDVGVLVKGLTYVPSVKKAVEERMKEERLRIAAKYVSEGEAAFEEKMGLKNRELKRIISEGQKKARDIEGLADGETVSIYAKGFIEEMRDGKGEVVGTYTARGLSTDPGFYEFMRTLQLYEGGLGGSNKVSLVLGSDNPLCRMVKGEIGKANIPPQK
jgi:membrane protease subunit HflC